MTEPKREERSEREMSGSNAEQTAQAETGLIDETTAAAEPRDAGVEVGSGRVETVICGASAALACAPGDEARMAKLAATVDRIACRLRDDGFGSDAPLSDPRFLLMVALCMADDVEAAEARATAAEAEAEAARTAHEPTAARKAFETSFAEIVSKAAKRLETAAGRIEGR